MDQRLNKVKAKDYKFDDKYLFIGLTSGALKNNEGHFVDHVKKIFDRNKKEINKGLSGKEEVSDDLFRPVVFNIFGDYDYAFLSLCDTFQFGAKNFRPYGVSVEDLGGELDELPFQYQCLYGSHLYQKETDRLTRKKLEQVAGSSCLSICQIKLNNSLVIGGGMAMLNYTQAAIRRVLDRRGLLGLVSLSFSWHEITFVCVADNYIDLYSAVKELRGLEFKLEEGSSEYPEWYKNTLHNAKKSSKWTDPIPLIKETNTKFGYRYFQDSKKQNKIIKGINTNNLKAVRANRSSITSLSYITRLRVKPERANDLLCYLTDKDPGFVQEHKPKYVSGRAVMNYSCSKLFSLFTESDVVDMNYIRMISTYLEFEDSEAIDKEAVNHQGLQKEIFLDLQKDLKTIEAVKKKCNDKHFPKMTTERVMRILVNYNRNVADPAIFSYFLELKGPLDHLIKKILEGHDPTYEGINKLLDGLESSFWTRYYHTPQFIYNGDTSTEHSGGILQILSSYDYIARKHGELAFSNTDLFDASTNHHMIINLTTNPGIKSTEKSILVNFYHLFQPCLIAATMMHECLNYFPSKVHDSIGDITSFLTIKEESGGKGDEFWNKQSFECFLNEVCERYIYFDKDHSKTDVRSTSESDGLYYAFSVNGLRILLIDYMTWLYGYRRNTELFLFWHFGCILQDTSIYDGSGQIKEEFFTQICNRFYLLAALINKQSATSVGQKVKMIALKDSLLSLVKDSRVEERKQDLKNYKAICDVFIRESLDVIYYEKQVDLANKRFSHYLKDHTVVSFKDLATTLTYKNIELTKEESIYIDNKKVLDDFRYLPRFVEQLNDYYDQSQSDFKSELELIYEYLQSMYRETMKPGDTIYFDAKYFVRTLENKTRPSRSPIQFNSVGGIFSTTSKVRNFMIQKNSEFYYTLWDLAQRDKVTSFNNKA